MREILFRGKTELGKWIEGDLLQYLGYGKVHIVQHHLGAGGQEVIPETVGQYTGLTDKNGKKIFEGDIVDCWSEGVNAKGTVQQRKDGLWIIYPNWQKYITWGLCPNEFGNTDVKVIGNIHDNPELLKGGAE